MNSAFFFLLFVRWYHHSSHSNSPISITHHSSLSNSPIFITHRRAFFCHLFWPPFPFEEEAWGVGKLRHQRLGEVHNPQVTVCTTGKLNRNFAFGGLELAIDKLSGGGEETREVVAVDKKNPGEPRKKPNGNKSSKPPRPPKGPVLTAYDLKLVKELTELAARKRARIERIKALRKMKESKRSTSSSSVPAMIMTALFFFILIFQGAFTGNNVRKQVVASPAPATLKDGLVPFQVLNNAPTNEMNQPSSLSFSTSEQPLSSSHHRKEGVDTR